MSDTIIFDNIVEVIKYLKPNHILSSCLEHEGVAINYQRNDAIRMPDDRIAFICFTGDTALYRGEAQIFDSCKCSLFRIKKRDDRIVALAKSYEFMEFLKTLPEVQSYVNNNLWYEPWAIAQHYGFATPMIDLTNEIAVAAFFATHIYDKVSKQYIIKTNGVGQIRGRNFATFDSEDIVRPIGVQPFARPSNQYGYEYWIQENEGFENMSYKIEFKQDALVNRRLEEAMGGPTDYYFPNEKIVQMASIIQHANVVTNIAVRAFASDKQYIDPAPSSDEIYDTLKKKDIFVVDAPVVCPEALPPKLIAFTQRTQLVSKPIYKKGMLSNKIWI